MFSHHGHWGSENESPPNHNRIFAEPFLNQHQ
ncbi:unnamed protein product [Larinioides sclopetarius]|uniref:Uncharacterized protein n=1 Tax=Larinioides sclopetarius TaxID=280406 RepID=A0AAV1Z533_9ARAC